MNFLNLERLALLTALALASCGDDGNTDDGSNPDTSDTDPPTTNTDTDPTASEDTDGTGSADSGNDDMATGDPDTGVMADCTDQMILDLALIEGSINEGGAMNTPDGAGFSSAVDATSGGIMNAAQTPWLYLRFTPSGLEKVDLDDFQALDSSDWDIAAKRFGIRLNGGVSGPSTVAAADLEGTAYEDIAAVPEVALTPESFYTADCMLVDDGQGQGAPGYRLTPWWTYGGCVQTTSIPFVIGLADGSHVKFVVDAYYGENQQQCNDTGMMGMSSANFTWRWAYLE